MDTSSEHTVSISGYRKTINKISEKYLPAASSGHYGVVDRDNIVVPYYFSKSVAKDVMEKAVDESQDRKAIIRWHFRNIQQADFFSKGGITVRFCDDPYAKYVYKPQDGMYDITKYESVSYPTTFTLSSSIKGSTKQFKITVDDSGTISATEVTP